METTASLVDTKSFSNEHAGQRHWPKTWAIMKVGVAALFMGAASGQAYTGIDLDSRNGLNGFVVSGGVNQELGSSVSAAGDVNDDGFADTLIGVPYATVGALGNAGAVYVVFGSAGPAPATFDPATLDGTNGFKIEGDTADSYFGLRVARGGDINGDGIDDILVGAPWTTGTPGVFTGAAFVIFGKATFSATFSISSLDGTNGFRMNGGAFNDTAATGLAGVGDVNSDGFDDVVVGAPGVDIGGVGNPGAAYLVFGKQTFGSGAIELATLNGTDGIQINGGADGDKFGEVVAAAGDHNADNIDDFLISAPGSDSNGPDSGTAYLVFGHTPFTATNFTITSLNEITGIVLTGREANSSFGSSLANAGDVNADGIDDIIIGAQYDNNITGAAFVALGTLTTTDVLSMADLDGTNGFVLTGEEFGATVGASVAGADLNGDGYSDLIMGGPNATENGLSAGAVYVAMGKANYNPSYSLSGADGLQVFKFNGIAGSRTGTSVSTLGDVNDDGRVDLAVGAPKTASGTGAAYTVFPFLPLSNAKLKVKLNFGAPDKDSISLKGAVPVAPGFSVANSAVTLNVGGVAHDYELDAKGGIKLDGVALKVKSKAAKPGATMQEAKFTFSQKAANLALDLADEGLVDTTVKNQMVDIKVTLTYSNTIYERLISQLYTAKQGKSGRTK